MQKIDTEYESLNQIDPEIVRFYSVDDRTRLVGFEEMNADGYSEPIYEGYSVIVLNKPNEVHYDYAESRRGRRLPKEVIDQAITDAIAWEDFHTNHDEYLYWLEVYRTWEIEQPTELVDDEEVVIAAPERPVINMDDRRAVYHEVHETHERDKWYPPSTFTEIIDDDTYTITTKSDGAHDDDWAAFLADPSPEYVKHLKLTGIEFQGVMCSATKEDMWGLGSVEPVVRAGYPVDFNFDSGETLVLTPDNIDAFQAVWVPFRLSFFQ